MKILHVVGDSKFGGASLVIMDLARAALRKGWEVDVLTTDAVFQSECRAAGIGVADVDCVWRDSWPWRDILGLLRLAKFLSSSDYAIVHTHTSKGGVIGRLAARLAGTQGIVHTVHGFAFHDGTRPLRRAAYVWLERLASRACHKVITVSNYHRDVALACRIAAPCKLVAIPNGVLPPVTSSRSAQEIREELGLGGGTRVLLAFGRLSEQKGIEYLLRGLAQPPCADLQLRLLIVGTGPLEQSLRQLASQLGIAGKVEFLGFRRDIGDLLRVADIVVLPSLWEGLSIAVLETLAASRPLIATAIPSNLEIFRETEGAALVRPADSRAIANAITELCSSADKRAALARAGREVYARRYRVETMCEMYLEEYKAVLERPTDNAR